MMSIRYKKGFTLLELLVAISIIAILSTVGLVSYTGVQRSARDARRRLELHDLKLALEQYQTITGSYPSTGGAWLGEPTTGGSHILDYIPNIVPTYIKKLPNDPLANTGSCGGSTSAGYWYKSDGIDYKVQLYYTPEGALGTTATNAYFDPSTYCAWQISTPNALNWN
ncbi:type II secretion system protein [Candidatus Microgenomates bacterium]|nr:type II secretion system protein [Candidatus Microgenomates bacterium]